MEIKEMAEKLTLTIKTETSVQGLPILLGKTYGEIMQYIQSIGAKPTGEAFVIYYNTDMSNLNVEIGFTVDGKYPNKGQIKSSSIPGGKYAIALHVGPYETLTKTYDELNAFILTSGNEAQTWVYEVYLNNPQENPKEQPKTMIYFPLK